MESQNLVTNKALLDLRVKDRIYLTSEIVRSRKDANKNFNSANLTCAGTDIKTYIVDCIGHNELYDIYHRQVAEVVTKTPEYVIVLYTSMVSKGYLTRLEWIYYNDNRDLYVDIHTDSFNIAEKLYEGRRCIAKEIESYTSNLYTSDHILITKMFNGIKLSFLIEYVKFRDPFISVNELKYYSDSEIRIHATSLYVKMT